MNKIGDGKKIVLFTKVIRDWDCSGLFERVIFVGAEIWVDATYSSLLM